MVAPSQESPAISGRQARVALSAIRSIGSSGGEAHPEWMRRPFLHRQRALACRSAGLGLCLAGAAWLVAIAAPLQTWAAQVRTYRYDVEHPIYGRIGSYTNVIEGPDADARVRSELHIAVKIFGIAVFREDATRTEQWHHNRMTSFDGLTVTNGSPLHVSGEAKGTRFAITSPAGTTLAPADVKPSNPWSMAMLHDGTMMSTKTGRLLRAHILAGPTEPVPENGVSRRARRYEVLSDEEQVVWFDDRGIAVAFATEEGGARISFVLAGG
jgi:hypothetical protein